MEERKPLTVAELLDAINSATPFDRADYLGREGDEKGYLDDHYNFSHIVRILNARFGFEA